MKQTNQLPGWQALQAHQQAIASQTMQSWFDQDPCRFEKFSLQLGDILFDYSKNRVTQATLQLLCKLAEEANLAEKIEALFTGKPLNSTESRSVLHTALRSTETICINDKNISAEIQHALIKMREFTEKVRAGTWLGTTGKPMRDIVNIGIGGSHLGPLMATYALKDFAIDSLRCHFISNIDEAHIEEVLKQINPETTLFIISSKSFTTLETLTNAQTIRKWCQQKLPHQDLASHFVAVTAAKEKAVQFGIAAELIFPLWEWVGGRYSVWSPIGLPIALMIGMDNFLDFLAGAEQVDNHFRQTEFHANIPVIMALLGIWYINFWGAPSHAIIPYSYQLNYLRSYVQQLDMESNGKRAAIKQGEILDYATGPVIWGEHGCDGQHAFHQLFHQGQHLVPIDFLLVGKKRDEMENHHDILIASALSQAEALLQGKSYEQALAECKAQGYSEKESAWLASHKSIPGNRPSNVLFLKKLTPRILGSLLALYEHKVFVQGVIWNINSFDQWGVELGKQLLPNILENLKNSQTTFQHDSSTRNLIDYYKSCRNES